MADADWVQSAAPYMQTFGPTVSWIIVIVGWKIVARDGDRRERRKEVRLMVNDVIRLIHEIERRAYEYYRSDHANGAWPGMEIRRELQRLSKLLGGLKRENPALDFDGQLKEFRQRVTGNDFDSATRVIRDPSNRLYLEISDAALELVETLEEKFGDIYSPVK